MGEETTQRPGTLGVQLIWDRDYLNHNPKAAATREFFFLIRCLPHLLEETISSPVSNQEVALSDTQSFSPSKPDKKNFSADSLLLGK